MKQKVGKGKIFGVFMAALMAVSAVQAFPVFAASKTVKTYNELAEAMKSSSVTDIELAANITLQAKEVDVNPAKSYLTINGNGYTITDADTTSEVLMFRHDKAGNLKNIIVKNTNFKGNNDNGFIFIADSSSLNNVKLTYDNVNYEGPQAIEAKYSHVVLKDSTFNLIPGFHDKTDYDELVQALTVTLEGNVEIEKDIANNNSALFYLHHDNGSITVAEGATVNVKNNVDTETTEGRYSGFVQMDSGDPGMALNFKKGSEFKYEGKNIFQKGGEFSKVNIAEDAIVDITTHGDFHSTDTILMVEGTMNVEKNAVLNVRAYENWHGSTNESEPALLFKDDSSLNFNSPREVFIYNSSMDPTTTGLAYAPWSGGDLKVTMNGIKSLEYWDRDDHNGRDYDDLEPPTYNWRNTNGSAYTMCKEIDASGSTSSSVDDLETRNYNNSSEYDRFTESNSSVEPVNVVSINGGRGREIPKTATVFFDSNGGSAVASAVVDLGNPVAQPEDPTWEGHTFDGWFLGDDAWDFNTAINGDITLVAHWTEVPDGLPIAQYYVRYYRNEATSDTLIAGETIVLDSPVMEGFDVVLDQETLDKYQPDGFGPGEIYINRNTPLGSDTIRVEANNQLIRVVYKELEEISFVIDHIEPMFFGDGLVYAEKYQEVVKAKVGDTIVLADHAQNDYILGTPVIAEVLNNPDRTYMNEFTVTEDLMNVNVYYTVEDIAPARAFSTFSAAAEEVDEVFTVDYDEFEEGMSVREYLEDELADFLAE